MYKIISKITPPLILKAIGKNNTLISIIQFAFKKVFPFPKVIQVHTTAKCNLKCHYCYSKHTQSYDVNWESILYQASKINISSVEFMGGEPFIDQNLKTYLSFCDRKKIKIKIYTNGIAITSEWISFLATLKEHPILVFKFDRIDLLEDIIGAGYFEKISKTIDNCVAAGINVHGHVIINKKNYNSILEIIDLAVKKKMVLTTERNMETSNVEIDSKLTLNQSEWNYALRQVNNFYKTMSHNYQINSIVKGNTCSCYVDLLSIDVDGFVKPCPFATEEQIIGSVRTETLLEIWKKFILLRKNWMKIPDECQHCQYKLLCHGGCKTNTFRKKQTYNAKDPLCNRSQIPTSIYSDQYLKIKKTPSKRWGPIK